MTPEEKARQKIDEVLSRCGWVVQDKSQANLHAARGVAIRQDPTGAAGRDVGNEADVTLRWTFRPRADVLFGYSHLFPGRFLLDTPGGAAGREPGGGAEA